MSSEWRTVEAPSALQLKELQLWRIELTAVDSLIETCTSSLTADELARANRRRQAQAHRHFVVGRGCLRLLLGSFLGIEPRLVPISAGPHGKPEVSSLDSDISFNVAHSASTILIALCRQACVGVDVEQVDPSLEFMTVAQASFTPTETMKLSAFSNPEQQRLAFYRYWTQKEAVAKADGRGLTLSMSSFEVPLSPLSAAPVSIAQSSGTRSKVYYVSDLPLGAGMAGAVAINDFDYSMKLLRFPPLDNSPTS